MGFELLAPSGAGVREQDVDVIGALAHLGHQLLDLGELGAVGGDGDGFCAGPFVGQGVEGGAGFLARRRFAAGYVDFRTAGLEEAGGFVSQKWMSKVWEWLSKERGIVIVAEDSR